MSVSSEENKKKKTFSPRNLFTITDLDRYRTKLPTQILFESVITVPKCLNCSAFFQMNII